MECFKCGSQTNISAERCNVCGADLFAPPPTSFMDGPWFPVGLLFVFGWFLFFVVSMQAHVTKEPSGRGWLLWLVYQLVGPWPLAVLAWIFGSLYAIEAWSGRPSERRSASAVLLNPDIAPSQTSMQPPTDQPTAPRNPAALHRALGSLVAVLAIVSLGFTYLGIVPLLGDTVTPLLEYVSPGIAFVMMTAAIVFLIPKTPRRRPGQSVEQFWSVREVGGAVAQVWLLLEAACVMAGVGYLLTGGLLSASAMALAMLAFWRYGPNHFATP
jgi:hypothetical protein